LVINLVINRPVFIYRSYTNYLRMYKCMRVSRLQHTIPPMLVPNTFLSDESFHNVTPHVSYHNAIQLSSPNRCASTVAAIFVARWRCSRQVRGKFSALIWQLHDNDDDCSMPRISRQMSFPPISSSTCCEARASWRQV